MELSGNFGVETRNYSVEVLNSFSGFVFGRDEEPFAGCFRYGSVFDELKIFAEFEGVKHRHLSNSTSVVHCLVTDSSEGDSDMVGEEKILFLDEGNVGFFCIL